jgi:hypothetical protein
MDILSRMVAGMGKGFGTAVDALIASGKEGNLEGCQSASVQRLLEAAKVVADEVATSGEDPAFILSVGKHGLKQITQGAAILDSILARDFNKQARITARLSGEA